MATGLTFGILGFTGLMSVLAGIAISNLSILYYVRNYLDLDDDDIENYEVYTESFMPTFFCFLLFWIITYTSWI